MPAVKTKPSKPPSTAAKLPARQPDLVGEVVDGEGGARIIARQQFAHIVADAGEALETAVPVEEVLNRFGRRHAACRHEIEHHAGIDLTAAACPSAGRRAR